MKTELELLQTFGSAQLFKVPEQASLVLSATQNYIPIQEFKTIFEAIGKEVVAQGIKCLIFDKTKLGVFHQPSMEWYFTEWKEDMYFKGLRKHYKILPSDEMFVQSVKIGRAKIDKEYPNKKFNQMEITYFDDLESALEG